MPPSTDLLILTADKDANVGIDALMARTGPRALGIRSITYKCISHPHRDSGCRRASEFLRPFLNSYQYALVVMDREGSGVDKLEPELIEKELEDELTVNGWDGKCAVVVIDPELEAWIWETSLRVGRILSQRMTKEEVYRLAFGRRVSHVGGGAQARPAKRGIQRVAASDRNPGFVGALCSVCRHRTD